MASLVLTIRIHSFLVSISHLLLYFSSVRFLRRATLQCQWMQHSCIEVILTIFFFPKENELTFHLKVPALVAGRLPFCSRCISFQVLMIIANGNIQQKVLEVRRQWAGEGGTACAAAGLGERKAASGTEQEWRGAPLRAVAWEMYVRPVNRQLEIPAPVSIKAGGISAGQRICFHTSFPTVWYLCARKFSEGRFGLKYSKFTKWLL